MSMTAGSASITVHKNVSPLGTVTWTATYGGTGMAAALAQARFALSLSGQGPYQRTGKASIDGPIETAVTSSLNGQASAIAANAQADASAIVTYMQANAVALVTNQSLGRIPASTAQDTPIEAPASPVNIPIR